MKNSVDNNFVKKAVKLGGTGVAAVAALAIHVGTAQALQIVQNQSFFANDSLSSTTNLTSASTVSLNNTSAGNTSFNRFDSGLGTLDSVVIDIFNIRMVGSASTTFRDTDFGQETSGITRLQSLRIDFSSSGFSSSRSRSNLTDTCSDGLNLGGASCTASVSFNNLFSGINFTVLGGSLGGYIGLGTWTMDVDQLGSVFNDETDGDDGFIDSRSASLSSSGDIRVTYNYTAAPPPPTPVTEPTVLAVFALGLAGLGYVRRRKQAA